MNENDIISNYPRAILPRKGWFYEFRRQRAIKHHKETLRRLLANYWELRDRYDCGDAMFYQMSHFGYQLAYDIDELLDVLETLGDNPPKGRYLRK